MKRQLGVPTTAAIALLFVPACDGGTSEAPRTSLSSVSAPSEVYDIEDNGAYQDVPAGADPYPNWPDISGASCQDDTSFITSDGNHHAFVCVDGKFKRK
jgi:hypothetical protein